MVFPSVITVAFYPRAVFTEIITNKDGRKFLSGTDVKLLHVLSKYLGFKFRIVFPNDLREGKELMNGSWTGMIGLLMNGEADIAMNVRDSVEKRNVIDITEAYRYTCLSVAMQMPRQFHDSSQFLQPLNTITWFLLIFCLLIFTILIAKSERNISYFRCFYDLIGSVLHQSSYNIIMIYYKISLIII